ncbi:hypothetical protein DPMN_052500 [Dreissena polymorpha]|uniref:Uncharacterized protein n=1 Tax=Dreissena polymorpha TaxID=45954 RepID=A0A9D4HN23_DREPO|nr:hypothetical protein DPMN_052479 [Dreissena polymorpha]KAH3726632.1 hypothetical protein DPMN_052500 [Dreissena polymorpha]
MLMYLSLPSNFMLHVFMVSMGRMWRPPAAYSPSCDPLRDVSGIEGSSRKPTSGNL